MFVLSRFSRTRFFATIWTIAHYIPLSMGFSRQEYWSGLPCPPPGDLSNPGIEPASFVSSVQSSSVSQSRPTLCDPMDCSTPGFAVHHQLLELAQTQVHRVSNASTIHLILSHPRLLLPSVFPSIRVFPNESVLLIRWPKYWSFSFSISPSNEYS